MQSDTAKKITMGSRKKTTDEWNCDGVCQKWRKRFIQKPTSIKNFFLSVDFHCHRDWFFWSVKCFVSFFWFIDLSVSLSLVFLGSAISVFSYFFRDLNLQMFSKTNFFANVARRFADWNFVHGIPIQFFTVSAVSFFRCLLGFCSLFSG